MVGLRALKGQWGHWLPTNATINTYSNTVMVKRFYNYDIFNSELTFPFAMNHWYVGINVSLRRNPAKTNNSFISTLVRALNKSLLPPRVHCVKCHPCKQQPPVRYSSMSTGKLIVIEIEPTYKKYRSHCFKEKQTLSETTLWWDHPFPEHWDVFFFSANLRQTPQRGWLYWKRMYGQVS